MTPQVPHDKIRKLLALATRETTPDFEALSAFRRAFEIAATHKLPLLVTAPPPPPPRAAAPPPKPAPKPEPKPAPPTTPAKVIITHKFKAWCVVCRKNFDAGSGYAVRDGEKWKAYCNDCGIKEKTAGRWS